MEISLSSSVGFWLILWCYLVLLILCRLIGLVGYLAGSGVFSFRHSRLPPLCFRCSGVDFFIICSADTFFLLLSWVLSIPIPPDLRRESPLGEDTSPRVWLGPSSGFLLLLTLVGSYIIVLTWGFWSILTPSTWGLEPRVFCRLGVCYSRVW